MVGTTRTSSTGRSGIMADDSSVGSVYKDEDDPNVVDRKELNALKMQVKKLEGHKLVLKAKIKSLNEQLSERDKQVLQLQDGLQQNLEMIAQLEQLEAQYDSKSVKSSKSRKKHKKKYKKKKRKSEININGDDVSVMTANTTATHAIADLEDKLDLETEEKERFAQELMDSQKRILELEAKIKIQEQQHEQQQQQQQQQARQNNIHEEREKEKEKENGNKKRDGDLPTLISLPYTNTNTNNTQTNIYSNNTTMVLPFSTPTPASPSPSPYNNHLDFVKEMEVLSNLFHQKIYQFKHQFPNQQLTMPMTMTPLSPLSPSQPQSRTYGLLGGPQIELSPEVIAELANIAATPATSTPLTPVLGKAPNAPTGPRRSAASISGWEKMRRGVRKITVINALTKKKFHEWSHTLRRMDPRFQILSFFDAMAQIGMYALADCNVHITGVCTHNCLEELDALTSTDVVNAPVNAPKKHRPSMFASPEEAALASSVFNQAGVFTVWRPTSLDSIRKMIVGDGVGKGLDIKGKSAKRGQFSGYVPFLQLHETKHKKMVRTIPVDAQTRLFFLSREMRDAAFKMLLAVTVDMLATYTRAQRTIIQFKEKEKDGKKYTKICAGDSQRLEDALEKWMWDLGENPSMTMLDDYAPKCYGLELSQRLLFEAYVMRGNCERPKGTIHETGRLSEPAFQDMNNETLRKPYNPESDMPRPVLILKSTEVDKAVDPRYLLMAYEERGVVKPVVSDFDCFLVGTRRITFDKPLPEDQVELMKWCITQIDKILDAPSSKETWTMRWLEALKREYEKGFHVTFPKYGFADPKSYSIMAHAVDRLAQHGSVRHGAECFNYYFPQDLDEEFLVVTNMQANGPWVKYSKEGLLKFLSQKIDDGFMFPVNPKWALCDLGWKELYDKQMDSDNPTTRKAMDAWYPPHSGIRRMIERIHTKHPRGFEVMDGPYQMANKVYSPLRHACEQGEEISGDTAMDMAELEIQHDRVLRKAIKAVNAVLFANRMNKGTK